MAPLVGRLARASVDLGDVVERVHWFAVVGVLGAALAAGVWFGIGSDSPPEIAVERVVPSPLTLSRAGLTVHVSGAVASPGLVEVAAGSRIADALAVAGGVLPTANLSALNLASPVVDGSQIVVPEDGEQLTGAAGAPTVGPVRLNSATVDQLQTLPGIGPVTAQRIVDHRTANGPYGAVEDLLDVPGIGEGRLAALRDLVVVP